MPSLRRGLGRNAALGRLTVMRSNNRKKDRLILAMLSALHRLCDDSMARIDARWYYDLFRKRVLKLKIKR